MLTLDLTEVDLAFGASSQSVSDSNPEEESEVAPLLLYVLASGRLRRPVTGTEDSSGVGAKGVSGRGG